MLAKVPQSLSCSALLYNANPKPTRKPEPNILVRRYSDTVLCSALLGNAHHLSYSALLCGASVCTVLALVLVCSVFFTRLFYLGMYTQLFRLKQLQSCRRRTSHFMVNRIHFPAVNSHSRFCKYATVQSFDFVFPRGHVFSKDDTGTVKCTDYVLGSLIPSLSLTLTVTPALTLCSAKIKNTCSALLANNYHFSARCTCYNTVLALVKVLRFHCGCGA